MLRGTSHRQTLKLRRLLESVLADFAPTTSLRRVTLEALVFVDELDADPSLLRPMLVSLIAYATRRASAGTNVIVVVSPRPGCVEFRVADEGSRLAPDEALQKVLARDAASPQKYESDLAYCRSVVEAQGGSFSIGETATGAVVCVTLPSAAGPRRSRAVHRSSGTHLRAVFSSAESTAQTILVVDDEPMMRTFVSRALKERGYGVIEADCAERAMDRLISRQQPLALLLSDVGLPGASGADLARQARLLNPGLPTLLMSATPKASLVWDGVIKQGTDLLQKPFSVEDLLAKLAKLVPQPTNACAR